MAICDDGTFCGGQVIEQQAPKACFWSNQLIAIVFDVPTGICQQCGERYYKADVLKRIEELLKDRSRFQPIQVPAVEYIVEAMSSES